jgi:hypothetical protein
MHDKNLRFHCNAMKGFRESKLRGMKRLQWDHGQFGPLQTAMHIPKTFVMPEQFFKEVRENERVAYNKRCCPLMDYYRQLCVDTPGYQSFIKAPMSLSGDKDEKVEYRPQRSYHGFSQRPADDTWGDNVSSSARSVNPSALNRDQVDRAEDAEKRRRRPSRDAPIPGEDESSSEDDGHLYMDKMLPADKLLRNNTFNLLITVNVGIWVVVGPIGFFADVPSASLDPQAHLLLQYIQAYKAQHCFF